jgi:mono/diheme cytochrome c family protein
MLSIHRHLVFLAAVAATVAARAELHAQTFEKDVRPILKEHCFRCHGEGEKLKGGVDLRLRRFMEKLTKDGDPIMVPGKPDESEMVAQIQAGDMPPKSKKLEDKDIATIEQWIAQGAKTARPEPEQVPKYWITEEERQFWSFQPIRRLDPPRVKSQASVRNPIDAFILAKLEEKGLEFNPEADRRTLLRRVTLDLTGLPPTPEESALFLADDAPDAYERLVDRLLASPHYGEQWGRHWLDVAGYSDSDGYTDLDPVRPWAYKYRDYVIRSLNEDKPFDQFIREQLAGDEMVPQPYKNLKPGDIEKLTATGFLRMAPDGSASATAAAQKTARNAVVSETLKVVSSSLLGMTVGCAQCHDHRYDPIPQSDYYRMRAIFEPAFDLEKWRVPSTRLVSLMTEADHAKSAEIEAEAKVVDAERLKKNDEFITEVLGRELAKKPEELREPLRAAYRTVEKDRTPAQVALLKGHPTVKQLSSSSLYLYDRSMADKLKVIADRAAEIRKRKPIEEFVPALTEYPALPKEPATFVFNRGDPDQPKEQVEPGDLTVLASFHPAAIPDKAPALPTSGRRLAFAKSLTNGTHPLFTRVIVNRVWHHHFGRGIVASLSDFGHLGDRPTHPELLDWLASEFVAKGWSLKQLQRLIVTSTTYRQASTHTADKDRIDPDNRLCGRANTRRIEAETIRDSMLMVSGKLNPKMFGAPVPVMFDEEGLVVVGVDTTDTAGRPSGKFVPLNGDEFRRSLYIQMRRSRPLGMLETFDLPRMEPNCELRNASTVAPQSLAMMNGDFTLDQSIYFAERVARDAGPSVAEEVNRAWELAFEHDPTESDLKDAVDFIGKQTAYFKEHPVPVTPPAKGRVAQPADPAMQALTSFCHALLTSNAFLYAD